MTKSATGILQARRRQRDSALVKERERSLVATSGNKSLAARGQGKGVLGALKGPSDEWLAAYREKPEAERNLIGGHAAYTIKNRYYDSPVDRIRAEMLALNVSIRRARAAGDLGTAKVLQGQVLNYKTLLAGKRPAGFEPVSWGAVYVGKSEPHAVGMAFLCIALEAQYKLCKTKSEAQKRVLKDITARIGKELVFEALRTRDYDDKKYEKVTATSVKQGLSLERARMALEQGKTLGGVGGILDDMPAIDLEVYRRAMQYLNQDATDPTVFLRAYYHNPLNEAADYLKDGLTAQKT